MGICILIFVFKESSLLLFIPTIIFGLILSVITRRGYYIPFITEMLRILDRKEDLEVLPGKGALMFLIGTIITLFLFQWKTTIIGVLILAISDSTSTIIGKKWGKHFWSKKKGIEGKTFEGTLGFLIPAIFILFLSVQYLTPLSSLQPLLLLIVILIISILATISEIQPYIDDNLVIPLVVAALLHLSISIVI